MLDFLFFNSFSCTDDVSPRRTVIKNSASCVSYPKLMLYTHYAILLSKNVNIVIRISIMKINTQRTF